MRGKLAVPKPSNDPVMKEIYRALAYHELTPPGSLIEMSCQRCPYAAVDSSPSRLAAKIWEHMRSRHWPEAWQ